MSSDEWFTFTTAIGGQTSIALDGDTGDLDLYLFDSSANILARSVSTSSRERVEAFLQPGTWFVGITAYQGA